MDGFTFDNANEAGNTGQSPNGVDSGKPGSNGGESGGASGDSGVESRNFRIEGEGSNPADAAAPLGYTVDGKPRKRRAGGGRKSAADASAAGAANAGVKVGVAIVRNDRAAVKQNILGLHAVAAVLTKQPILALDPKEADLLGERVCDVADYHGTNLIAAGGAFGLYASLCTACYLIYAPRIAAIKHGKETIDAERPKPPNPGDAREAAMNGAGTMDFSGDVLH